MASFDSFLRHLKKKLEERGLSVKAPIAMPNYVVLTVSFREESTDMRVQSVNHGIAVEYDSVESPTFSKRLASVVRALPYQEHHKRSIEDITFDPNTHAKPVTDKEDPDSDIAEAINPQHLDEAVSVVVVGTKNFFGPVIMAGVQCKASDKQDIEDLLDMKKPSKFSSLDSLERVEKMMEICAHSAIIMGNKSYNEFYAKFQNVQLVFSWGICRMLKNIAKQTPIHHVFTNNFGSRQLIDHETKKIKPTIQVYNHTDRQHTASKLATLIANIELANQLGLMKRSYGFEFSLGSEMVVQADAYKFVEKFGKDQLEHVAKLNFPLFEELETKNRTLKKIKRLKRPNRRKKL